MGYNPNRHNRHSIRLRNYNYANAAAYFVTICLNQRIVRNSLQTTGNNSLQTTGRHIGLPLLGTIENGIMTLNGCGKIIEKYILEIANNADKFANIKIDEYIIMPDHIHAIIEIKNNAATNAGTVTNTNSNPVGADLCVCPCKMTFTPCATTFTPCATQLGTIVQWFKTMTTNEYANNVKTLNWQPFNKKLWQRNYYEYIIRNEAERTRIAKYIRNNPILWKK